MSLLRGVVDPELGSDIVELVFEPQWDRSMMSEEARLKTGLM